VIAGRVHPADARQPSAVIARPSAILLEDCLGPMSVIRLRFGARNCAGTVTAGPLVDTTESGLA
jgi:hypothetical protein